MNAVEVNLYRHGHTRRNDTPDIVFGQSLDEPLDELGFVQAYELGVYQRDHFLIPDLVRNSHAERALMTAYTAVGALVLSGSLTRDIVVESDERLVEQSLGSHEGMRREDVYTDDVKAQIDRERGNYRHPNGESMMDLMTRGYAALLDAASVAERSGARQIDLYSHNMTIESILARLDGADEPDSLHGYVLGNLRNKRLANVSRTLVVWENGRFNIELVGEPTIL